MRMTVAGGVSSLKRGRNGGGGSNSDDGNDAPVAQCGHEDEGERGGVLARPVKERNGGRGRKGTAATCGVLHNSAAKGGGVPSGGGRHRPTSDERGRRGDMERPIQGRKGADWWVPWHSSGARSNEFESDSKFKRFK
jgi:hypothetical protein